MNKSNQIHEMFRKTPRGERYKLLWRMTKRYYDAFKSINEGSPEFPFLSKFDIVQSFFIFCYHLKDWLNNDLNIKVEDIRELFSSNPELRYCADLCDGFKHLRRTKKLHSKSQPDYEKKVFEFREEIRIPGCKFIISTDQGDMDAFILASKCMDIWYEFIVKYDPTISKEL
ncbi:MAG: hypothetical protein ABSF88_02610 [Candidatus Aminicenantales bacterium]